MCRQDARERLGTAGKEGTGECAGDEEITTSVVGAQDMSSWGTGRMGG
jgi:hypothetical protein